MSPKRIQRKRTKGWRMPPGAVYVGRPTKWGNPYRPDDFRASNPNRKRLACEWYAEWLRLKVMDGLLDPADLRGKDLVCWCAEDAEHCHADVLLELANRETR